MSAAVFTRRADPYLDTDVIDARAPRVNQTLVALVSLAAVATGAWVLLLAMAAQLAIGLRFGRRYCIACVLYFEVLQPRLGEGPLEDSRPPRFANFIGLVVLTAAGVAYAVGATVVGAALGLLVAALATLAATTGLCVGCEMYRIGARLRGIRPGGIARIALADLPATVRSGTVVQFTHPLCTDCTRLERELRASGQDLVTIDVSRQPDLARRYQVALVPTAVRIDETGRVLERIA